MQTPAGEHHLSFSVRVYSDRPGFELWCGPAEVQRDIPKTAGVERKTLLIRFSENSESIGYAMDGDELVVEPERFRVVIDIDWLTIHRTQTNEEEADLESLIRIYVKGYLAALHGGQAIVHGFIS